MKHAKDIGHTGCESSMHATNPRRLTSRPVFTDVYDYCASSKGDAVLYVAVLLEDLSVYEGKIAV